MYFLKRLWGKMRYGSPIRILADGLGRLGIHILPYYVFLEELAWVDTSKIKQGLEGCKTVLLGPSDMKRIAAIPGRPFTEEDLLQRLKEGCDCLGVMHNGELAAFSWINYKRFSSLRCHTAKLENDEAFLFDLFTFLPYRGRGLAPYIRYECYKKLAAQGKRKFYSICGYFDGPALQFRKKLNAHRHELYLSISIGRWWQFIRLLKRY